MEYTSPHFGVIHDQPVQTEIEDNHPSTTTSLGATDDQPVQRHVELDRSVTPTSTRVIDDQPVERLIEADPFSTMASAEAMLIPGGHASGKQLSAVHDHSERQESVTEPASKKRKRSASLNTEESMYISEVCFLSIDKYIIQ
jgi:hypothetical protein